MPPKGLKFNKTKDSNVRNLLHKVIDFITESSINFLNDQIPTIIYVLENKVLNLVLQSPFQIHIQ